MTAYLKVTPRLTKAELDQARRTFLAGPKPTNDAPTCAGCGAILNDGDGELCPDCERKNIIPPKYGLTATEYHCPTCDGKLVVDGYNLWQCPDCGKTFSNEVTHGAARPVFPVHADETADEYCYSCGGPYTLTCYNGVNLCARCLATVKSLEGGPSDADLDAIADAAKRRAEAPLAELEGEVLEKWIADIADDCTFHDCDEAYCTCCGCTGEPIADCPVCDAPVCEDCLKHHHVCDLGRYGNE